MSSHQRKLTEAFRIAEATQKALKTDAKNNEYSRGLYNGFALMMSIITRKDYEPIEIDYDLCPERTTMSPSLNKTR